jgi:hypothetical protein
MNNLIISSNKENYLIDTLCQIKSQECDLTILSCYVNPKSVISLVDKIKERKTLRNIKILCDRKEASKVSSFEFHKQIQEQNISIYLINTGKLFHPKAYCLSNIQEQNGILCVSSANLTHGGLTEEKGNTEIFIEANQIHTIISFVENVEKLIKNNSNNDLFKKSIDFSDSKFDESDFTYALLNLGKFCHKWEESISDYFKISYDLTASGKSNITNKKFTDRGLKLEAKTLTKTYINQKLLMSDIEDESIKKRSNLMDTIRKNYAIDSFLGQWVPNRIIESIQQNPEGFNDFKQIIKRQIIKNTAIDSPVIESIYQDVFILINDNKENPYISRVLGERVESFKDKSIQEQKLHLSSFFGERINSLFKQDVKMRRIYNGIEIIDLPYSIENKNEVVYLYESLREAILSRENENRSAKAFLIAGCNRNLSIFYKSKYLIKMGDEYLESKHGFISRTYIPSTLIKREIKLTKKISSAYKTEEFQEVLKLHCALANSNISQNEKEFLQLEKILKSCKIYKQWSSVVNSDDHDFLVEVEDIEKELWGIEHLS